MLFLKTQVICVILFQTVYTVNGLLDPVSLAVIGAAAASYFILSSKDQHDKSVGSKVVKYIGQKIGAYEGCEDYWIPTNLEALEVDMKTTVFGQQLAINTIMGAMRNHLKQKVPDRALMLSFHGGPGTGKNFIAKMILKNMFRKGENSEYSIFFRSSIDFPLKEKKEEYKRDIVNKIKEKVYECHRSIFVFDEVEKMPSGLLDVLSGFVKIGQYREYDFRRVIFILLSNIGSEMLFAETLQNRNDYGGIREEMDETKLHKQLLAISYNEKGGLEKTGVVKSFGISHYVPFLPLEKQHVIQCLEKEVAKLHQVMSNELTAQVLEEMTFQPYSAPIFSVGGCKGIAEIAGKLTEREIKRKEKSRL
uniref:AAA+ ATPase domain-containing protein n=1 Tax=Graphocephala atropunctata TaxID=36148 RepID=A0A1B6LD14_9HEMI